jgi:hypothetical protein
MRRTTTLSAVFERKHRFVGDSGFRNDSQEVEKMVRTVAATPQAAKGKVAMIVILYVMSVLIMLLGAGFCAYSAINDVQMQVMSSTIPGFVFGMVILFLGVRYFMSLSKLRDEVMKSSGFSWGNFRKEKRSK